MAAPTKVYARKVWANVTPEQLADLNREATLTGSTASEVVRQALTAYFARSPKTRRTER